MPAAEPEIEPRCPGLVSKLPGLSRRATSRLRCGGIFLPVKAKALTGRVNPPRPRTLERCPSVHPSAQPHADAGRGGRAVPVGPCQLCRLPPCAVTRGSAVSGHGAAGRVSSPVPFPPRCGYRAGSARRRFGAAVGSCRLPCLAASRPSRAEAVSGSPATVSR